MYHRVDRLRQANPRIWLLHGFNVWDRGKGTILTLKPYLEDLGFEVLTFSPGRTGWRGLFMAWFGNAKRARKLASMLQVGDTLWGHSDGCNIINQALWMVGTRRTHDVIYSNPALDSDTPIPPSVRKCLVFHTMTDNVVRLGGIIPFNRWGSQGHSGYRPRHGMAFDTRCLNASHESLGQYDTKHSGIFKTTQGQKALIYKAKHYFYW